MVKRRITARKKLALINTIVFGTVLAHFGFLFFIMPKQEISDFEKRKLSPFPTFSWESFFHGNFIDSIDLYVADNFPFRDELVSLSFSIKENRGIRNEEIAFYNASDIKKVPEAVENLSDTLADSLMADTAAKEGAGEEVNNLFIYEGAAMEIFGGNNAMAKAYANAINKYRTELEGSVAIYDVLIPSSIEFNAPSDYRKMSRSQKENIDAAYSNLSPGIKAVDAYGSIAAHSSQYLYFRTDHHWTGLGAYYAYTAFCASAGFTPVPLENMEKRAKGNFLGSLYWLTRDSRLKEKPDSVIYYKIPGKYKTVRWSKGSDKPVSTSFYADGASGSNGYGVFLGGDWPLMRIEKGDTEQKNGRKAVLVKNSYGNPFATYLPSHFDKVFVLDYRYYEGSLLELIRTEGITDVIFINGVFSANTSWHIHMIGKVMRGVGKKVSNSGTADSLKPQKDTIIDNRKDSVSPGNETGGDK